MFDYVTLMRIFFLFKARAALFPRLDLETDLLDQIAPLVTKHNLVMLKIVFFF